MNNHQIHFQNKTERCYAHNFHTDNEGIVKLAFVNDELELGLALEYKKEQLPYFNQWKMLNTREYVVGLEPGNCLPVGISKAEQTGMAETILPGEKEHTLVFQTSEPLSENERILLQGEFGVDLKCEKDYSVYASGTQYNLLKYLPEKAKVFLRKRPEMLHTYESWTEQGHPFYSGTVTYCWNLHISEQCTDGILYLPKVHDHCKVLWDGQEVSECIFRPYQCTLGDVSGTHLLQIAVTNSMANAMEYYRAPSGITQGARIKWKSL